MCLLDGKVGEQASLDTSTDGSPRPSSRPSGAGTSLRSSCLHAPLGEDSKRYLDHSDGHDIALPREKTSVDRHARQS